MKTILDQIAERAEKATSGPWKRDPFDGPRCQIIASGNEVIVYHGNHARQVDARIVPNFDFIAHSRDDLPKLVAVARAAQKWQEWRYKNPKESTVKEGVTLYDEMNRALAPLLLPAEEERKG